MLNFCTSSSSEYFDKCMALILSLQIYAPSFHLYVLANDDAAYDRLQDIPNVTAARWADIDDDETIKARVGRTELESVWTMKPVWLSHVMRAEPIDSITWLDADCCLFSDPAPMYAEIGDANVAVTPHRWTPQYVEWLHINGLYNSGFAYFTRGGLPCLDEWREQCLDWCYYRSDNGRLGDQGYLELWPEQYGAHVIRHLGVNLAPWNNVQYDYSWRDGQLYISDGVRDDPLIFYHFHQNKWGTRRAYVIDPTIQRYVYEPYEAGLRNIHEKFLQPVG